MARSESAKKGKKAKKKRSESTQRAKKDKKKRKSSASADRQVKEEAAAKSGPKLAFRFAERGKEGAQAGDARGVWGTQCWYYAAFASLVDWLAAKRRRPKEEELRRRSFTVEELAALAQLAGSGLQAVKAQVADGQGIAVHLSSALSAARKLGQAEKVLLKAILEPSTPDQPLGIGPELIQAFGLVPKTPRVQEDPEAALAKTSDVPPPPPSAPVPPGFTSPPPPPAAPVDPGTLLPKKRTVPLEEWPPPSTEAVQQMLSRFPQLDGHCRGSLMNLPAQYALAILWDMDAKGGPEEIRDPQGFVFSATQTLLRLPVPMGGCAAVAAPAGLAPLAPAAAAPLVPTFVGAA